MARVSIDAMAARVLRIDRADAPKVLMFCLFGLLLEAGLGIAFCAGDAGFLTSVGADQLPIVFMLTPVVMLLYTFIYSHLLARMPLHVVVMLTLCLLAAGGALFWAMLAIELPDGERAAVYFALKLYLTMWQIALFSLFWNFADTYFDIQDAKKLFPLFAAASACGMAIGSLLVTALAGMVPNSGFFLLWGVVALATLPLVLMIRDRFETISDAEQTEGLSADTIGFGEMMKAFLASPYSLLLTGTLFVTLLMTNLAEFQYATVFSSGRNEAELAAMLGWLYALANILAMFVSLLLFNRLVGRFGVRNIIIILPALYFIVFSYFFVHVGVVAAVMVFMTNNALLPAIEHNNQNLLFNGLPSSVKHRLRTLIEGLCEPFSSCLAGAFLLFIAPSMNLRDLSGIGILLAMTVIVVALFLRRRYPDAMAANMQRGWLDFSQAPIFRKAVSITQPQAPGAGEDPVMLAESIATMPSIGRAGAVARLQEIATPGDVALVPPLLRCMHMLERDEQIAVIGIIGMIGDVETIPDVMWMAEVLGPRERRSIAVMLSGFGGVAVPALVGVLRRPNAPYAVRRVAARALTAISFPQFIAMLAALVKDELEIAHRARDSSMVIGGSADRSRAAVLLSAYHAEQVDASVDYVLNLLALGRLLPNYDALIVSLNSPNRKVRGNAIEAIENGIDRATFRRLRPLLGVTAPPGEMSHDDVLAQLREALLSGDGFEAAAAAQCLRDLTPRNVLAAELRAALRVDMAPALRETIATLLGLPGAARDTLIDRVAKLRARPEYRYASTPALMALTAAGGKPEDVDRVSGRFYDLALSRLKARDEIHHAA